MVLNAGSEKAAGQSSPKKSASKRKASDAGSPDAAPASGSKAKKKKKPSPAEGEGTKNAKYEEEAWVPPPVVPIEVSHHLKSPPLLKLAQQLAYMHHIDIELAVSQVQIHTQASPQKRDGFQWGGCLSL